MAPARTAFRLVACSRQRRRPVELDRATHRRLLRLHRLERLMTIEQLTAQRQVESLDLARSGRGRRLGEPVRDRVLPADLVEQDLPALTDPIRELFAIVSGFPRAPRT